MKKTIEIKKHPYMFKVDVTFGSFDEMVYNRYRYQSWNGGQVFIGGTFNEQMNKTSRASLVEVAVEFDYESFKKDKDDLHFFGVKEAKGIRYSCWEGTYCYYPELFDEEMKRGLFPVRADWDGKTYIERWDKKRGYHYELTDTYRY